MRGKGWYISGFLLLALGVAFIAASLADPGRLSNMLLNAGTVLEPAVSDERKGLVEADYDVSFAYTGKTPDNIDLFIPEYDYLENEQSALYLRFFDIGAPLEENMEDAEGYADGYYTFYGDKGELHINKFFNHIVARFSRAARTEASLTAAEALSAALACLDGWNLSHRYEEYTVTDNDDGFTVTLYGKTGRLINRAHPVTVTLDKAGTPLALDYYGLSYERLAQVNIISMKEGYYDLPLLAELGFEEIGRYKADLKRCVLAYVFQDSILQPAYIFEGEIIGRDSGETVPFAYSVPAAKYR